MANPELSFVDVYVTFLGSVLGLQILKYWCDFFACVSEKVLNGFTELRVTKGVQYWVYTGVTNGECSDYASKRTTHKGRSKSEIERKIGYLVWGPADEVDKDNSEC